jgi:hypothetical protein
LIFTRSHPRSLLSIARSNARSRSQCSRSSQNRIAHTCCGFSARLLPSFRPAFHGRRSLAPGSYSECPIVFLLLATAGLWESTASCSTPKSLAESGPAASGNRNIEADIRARIVVAALDATQTPAFCEPRQTRASSVRIAPRGSCRNTVAMSITPPRRLCQTADPRSDGARLRPFRRGNRPARQLA